MSEPAAAAWCAVCWDMKTPCDMQELLCGHSFCAACIVNSVGTLCPAPLCSHSRCTDVVIDETNDGHGGRNISFGGKLPSVLDLEERQKCDGKKGVFQCVNLARLTLLDCRHRLCFDCLIDKINNAVRIQEVPSCPLPRCSNRITKAEVLRLLDKCSPFNSKAIYACKQVMELMPPMPNDDPEGEKAGKDEIVVECSMYGRDATTKRISVPKLCMIVDMVSAMMQLLRVPKTRGLSTMGVFLRRNIEHDAAMSIMASVPVTAPRSRSRRERNKAEHAKVKYEAINLKQIGKKAVKDLNPSGRTHIVFDVENLLKNELKKNGTTW